MASNTLSIRMQTWSDDLRLPCITDTSSIAISSLYELHGPPIPFQSKHLPALKRNTWFALKRPRDKSRTGLLCIVPELQACIYISGDQATRKPGPRVALLRLRLDPMFLAAGNGPTVFAATLSASARRLWIEDVLQWKGRDMHDESFQERWKLVTQWIEHYCLMDSRLVGGVEIEAAPWQPLNTIQPDGIWELQCDDPGRRRLLWIANTDDDYAGSAAAGSGSSGSSGSGSSATGSGATVSVPYLDNTVPPTVVAKRESGPDQWSLTKSDGTDLGRALIRKLEISSALRSLKGASVQVEIAWVEDFGKWEIRSLLK